MNSATETTISEIVDRTKKNWPKLAVLDHYQRVLIINKIAEALQSNIPDVLKANRADLEVAQRDNLSKALIDRLTLTEKRLEGMIGGLQKIAAIEDPLATIEEYSHPNGMLIQKMRVPIGVILVVYEARPNVTTDTVGLAIKTGNSAILKGSRQTKFTNKALAKIVLEVLVEFGIEETIVFFPELNSEESIQLVSSESLDLVIPRGGEGLKKFVQTHSKAPILGAGGGICHLYVSDKADLEKAAQIIDNAKTQRPGVCNALETVLLHKSLLNQKNLHLLFNPILQKGVQVRADEKILKINPDLLEATEEDWKTEYLDLVVSVKSVSGVEEAIKHINFYGTGHSDSIITKDEKEAELFCKLVDSGCVYVNASTRFTDGEEFGFGAEIGISTQKLHARGPIGPKELTTYKYIIKGNGQVRP